jgi:succinate-semialdehyde dehydrogenase
MVAGSDVVFTFAYRRPHSAMISVLAGEIPCSCARNSLFRRRQANLLVEGAGHSAALHSNDEANIRYTGLQLPISRLVVNQPSSLTAGGSLTNGFAPTTTLGCGSWGGNSISENLDYKHLMNVSRIGKVITSQKVPTDAEIWA